MQGSGNQVALVDVLGAGDDLDKLFAAYIDLADPHMVRVLVADDGSHPAHQNILDFSVHPLVSFHLLAEDGELLDVFLVGDVGQVHELLMQPFSVEFHG